MKNCVTIVTPEAITWDVRYHPGHIVVRDPDHAKLELKEPHAEQLNHQIRFADNIHLITLQMESQYARLV